MARNADADDDAQDATTLDLDALEPGRVVELTYDGSRGIRTVRGYVAAVETEDAILDRYVTDYEVRIGTPDDHTPRFLRLSFDTTPEEDDAGAYSFSENWELVYSMNSKSSGGQKLGAVEAVETTDEFDPRGVEVAAFRDLCMGDRVQVEDRTGTVVDPDGHGVTVEFDDGDREALYYNATRGVYYSVIDAEDDYSKTVHSGEFEVLPGREEPTDEEVDLWETATSYGAANDRGAVETLIVDGDAYEVVYRPTDSDPNLRLRSPEFDEAEARRNYDVKVHLDPTGLRMWGVYGNDLGPRTLDPATVSLVYEEDDSPDENGGDTQDDEGDSTEALTDGGTTTESSVETTLHGVMEASEGVAGVAVLWTIHPSEATFRARLRPVTPLDAGTFERGEAWTLYAFEQVDEPKGDADVLRHMRLSHVPPVVREAMAPAVVQCPDAPATVGGNGGVR